MDADRFFLDVAGASLEAKWFLPQTSPSVTDPNAKAESRAHDRDPATPAIVLLHEGLGSLAQWKDFPARVAERTHHPVLAYSRAGYGASSLVTLPRPLTYMQEEGLSVLGDVLDAAKIRSCVVVGHSDGASIAIIHAGGADGTNEKNSRRRVGGLVLLAPHVFCEDVSITSIEAAKQAYLHGDLRSRLAKYHTNVDVAFWGWNGAWLDPEFRKWNIEEFLPRISVPLTVVQGADDPYGTIAQVDAIERGVRGDFSRVILERVGHAPRENEEATLAAIADLVKKTLDREPSP